MRRGKRSDSPAAQLARKKAYREKAGPVSNPGYPSKVNRMMRRGAQRENERMLEENLSK